MRDYNTFGYPFDQSLVPPGIKEGTICWLPKKDRIPQSQLTGLTIDDGGFGHPVVVLTKSDTTKQVRIALITSFDGRDLIVKHQIGSPMRSCYLPIWPSDAHPESGLRLYLENMAHLPKKSYVKVNDSHLIDSAVLEPFYQYRYSFDSASLGLLAKRLGFKLSSSTSQNRPPVSQIQRNSLIATNPSSNVGALAQSQYPDQSYNRLYSHVLQSYDSRTDALRNARLNTGIVRSVPETRPLLPQSQPRSGSLGTESSSRECNDCSVCVFVVVVVVCFVAAGFLL